MPDPTIIMETITINSLELASELAHQRLEQDPTLSQIYVNDTNAITYYTDEAQDLFNEWYDYYLTAIENCRYA